MPPRLSSQRVLSFISFYSCSHLQPGTNSRAFSTCLNASASRVAASRRISSRLQPSLVKKRSFHASSSNFATAKDPYQVLGVKKDASPVEIKKKYFGLARKYHPDTNPDKGAQEKFVEIQAAYDILKDEKKRADYEKYGAASQEPGFNPDAFANAGTSFGGAGFQGFKDFSGTFGGRGRPRRHEDMHGSDLEATVGVTFMEACKGTSRTINVTPVVNCSTCSGTGLKAGAKRSTCTSCSGTGTRTYVIDNGFQMASTCPTCQGTGTTVPRGSQCGECAGVGQVRIRKNVKVDIPAGVEDGMTIRLPNAGDAPISGRGRAGDLLVRINVAASKLFRRQGPNLHHEARIPLHTALLGGRVRVPTLDGEVDVRVPGGTQQGEEMVLKGRGVSSVYGGDKGDLFVTFGVQLPRSLTNRQREILQQYADEVEGRTTSTSPKGFTSTESSPDVERGSGASSIDENDGDNEDQPASPRDEEDLRKTAAA